ncbi:MAG TPA: enolase C-terminal domain-like protein [Flavobacteriales bacterium]
MLKFSYCPYRLLFKRPFGTAHGLRTGTDSIFVRVEENGFTGYGEATLPPYLTETPAAVVERLQAFVQEKHRTAEEALIALQARAWQGSPGCRAALHMALIDLISRSQQRTVAKSLELTVRNNYSSLMTIGIMPATEIEDALRALPASGVLKVKVDGSGSLLSIEKIKSLDNRKLLIDSNQGLRSVDEALELIRATGEERILGFEQPFDKDAIELHAELGRRTAATVYADESIQDLAELEARHEAFGGINLKLMKCGGVDLARTMAERSLELGKQVMLGSMSESSLGCTAMAHLIPYAAVVDLDGPWLIQNDPFVGITMENGLIRMPGGPGWGTQLRADLGFASISA